ncbi:LisH dimerisation motif, subgroup [Lasallia pustulata]|uniref:LisH dimerisation motif, subgroup n=1 Tax=Lasallia pustulata TaxID=136370 RepID=A0A1W5D027_9LECA|nr:LisH dimerisation motif, subgroup [Lasallia pustulata]
MAHHLHSNAPTNPHRVSQGLHASILRLQTAGVYGDQTSQPANMTSTASTATPTRHPFERRVDEVKLSKTDINYVIMDYLIREGYPSAAQKFALEANIQPTIDLESIQERVEIRNAIYGGDIQSAIERINELNPQILDQDSSLHFALLRLQLVELIRTCTTTPNADITPALTFATTHLAPRAPTNPEFLEDLERTMALLIFPPDNLAPPLAALLDPSLRKDVAKRVNEAILSSQGERTKAKLFDLVKLRFWAEQKARDAKKDLPEHIDLGLDPDQNGREKREDSVMQSNGEAEPMIT